MAKNNKNTAQLTIDNPLVPDEVKTKVEEITGVTQDSSPIEKAIAQPSIHALISHFLEEHREKNPEAVAACIAALQEVSAKKDVVNNPERMKEIVGELEIKAKEYNDAYAYHEVETTKVISDEMDRLVDEYNDLAEAEIIRICRLAEKPLVEAAVRLKYATIAYKDVALDKKDKGNTTRQIDWRTRYIDTQKLHKAGANGVGEDTGWINSVQFLNCLLTVRRAYELGIPQRELNKISDCYAMKQEARKYESILKTSSTSPEEVILEDLDKIVKMMIGQEYSARMEDVKYLGMVYSRKSTKSNLTVAVSNHSNMRNHMLDICHSIITGEGYSVDVKLNKKAAEAWDAAHTN